jgi:hypothetical protein
MESDDWMEDEPPSTLAPAWIARGSEEEVRTPVRHSVEPSYDAVPAGLPTAPPPSLARKEAPSSRMELPLPVSPAAGGPKLPPPTLAVPTVPAPALATPTLPPPTLAAPPAAPPVDESYFAAPMQTDGETYLYADEGASGYPEDVVSAPVVAARPVLKETQPIQVLPRFEQAALPQPSQSGAGLELPRLDVSLAGDPAAAAALLIHQGPSPGGKTRLHLPQLGEEWDSTTPADFLTPPDFYPPAGGESAEAAQQGWEQHEATAEPAQWDGYHSAAFPEDAAPPAWEENYEQTVHHEQSWGQAGEEGTPLEDIPEVAADYPDYDPTAYQHVGHTEASAPWESSYSSPDNPAEGTYASDQGAAPGPALAPLAPMGKIRQSQTGREPIGREPIEEDPNDSFASLFAENEAAAAEFPETPALPFVIPSRSEKTAQRSSLAAPILPTPPPGLTNEDDLDELLGNATESAGLSRSAVVMISVIAAVAVIATITVVVFANAMGGFQVLSDAGTIEDPADRGLLSPVPSGTALADSAAIAKPTNGDAPAQIDPVATERVAASSPENSAASLSGNLDKPLVLADSAAPARIELPEEPVAEPPAPNRGAGGAPDPVFEQSVQEIVQRSQSGPSGAGLSVIGGAPAPDLGVNPSANLSLPPLVSQPQANPASLMPSPAAVTPASPSAAVTPAAVTPAAVTPAAAAPSVSTYNPPATFPVPNDPKQPLGQTREVIDAYLRAPDWQTRLRYTYQGESLKPTIEEYYKKYTDKPLNRYALDLYHTEENPEFGGPYWVYLVSTNDAELGAPLIVRAEDGLLKVDWEIYTEFADQHFVTFQTQAAVASPRTFRLLVERLSGYYGGDRATFTDLDDYDVFQINPPYGMTNEFAETVFLPKSSELAKQLAKLVKLGEEPLAVIVTLDWKTFPHGAKHLVLTNLVTEGWFR